MGRRLPRSDGAAAVEYNRQQSAKSGQSIEAIHDAQFLEPLSRDIC